MIMNAVTLDNRTYNDMAAYARLNNISIAEAVNQGLHAFLNMFKTRSDESKQAHPATLSANSELTSMGHGLVMNQPTKSIHGSMKARNHIQNLLCYEVSA